MYEEGIKSTKNYDLSIIVMDMRLNLEFTENK